ncbi:unnamed protein product [Heligmosomoides polygyrus]|uniref:PX domain-containing protein n=1 Tax=Heligmosomoides polygyrus TaxID=6339 RepID=A0A3P8B5E3_HELPZ|nr:unnamed protein product [Heligmosomoides polygyrus]
MLAGTFANPLYFFATNTSNVTQAEMWVRLPDILEFFFVAHPSSGRREGEEHQRIMYFYPKGETLDRQAEITGFAEAVVNFTDNFVSPEEQAQKPEFPFRTVSTQKSEHVYIQVENYVSILVRFPAWNYQLSRTSRYSVFLAAIQNVLTNVYKMFRLFFGEFSPFSLDRPPFFPELYFYRKRNEQKFKERLEYFLGRYLPLLKLHRMPLLDYLNGAAFLPLNGPTYLNVVSMTSELVEEFPLIQKVLILYQDKVLYYSLSRRDLPSLFRYLTQSLLPMTIGDELLHFKFRSSQGRFLRGPTDLTIDAPLAGDDALPTVHLFNSDDDEDNEELIKYQMMVYRCLNATVCMFTNQEVTRKLLRNIDGYLGSELSKVASQIGDCIGAQNPDVLSTPDFHYIYFNPASLSLTSSFTESADTPKPALPPPEVSRLVCSSLTSFLSDADEFGECFSKSESDWLSDGLLALSNGSLADVQSRTLGIIKTHFEAIFLN